MGPSRNGEPESAPCLCAPPLCPTPFLLTAPLRADTMHAAMRPLIDSCCALCLTVPLCVPCPRPRPPIGAPPTCTLTQPAYSFETCLASLMKCTLRARLIQSTPLSTGSSPLFHTAHQSPCIPVYLPQIAAIPAFATLYCSPRPARPPPHAPAPRHATTQTNPGTPLPGTLRLYITPPDSFDSLPLHE